MCPRAKVPVCTSPTRLVRRLPLRLEHPTCHLDINDAALSCTDYIVLTQGELVFKTHDGESRVIRSGDVLVQVANAHEWLNETDQTARECHERSRDSLLHPLESRPISLIQVKVDSREFPQPPETRRNSSDRLRIELIHTGMVAVTLPSEPTSVGDKGLDESLGVYKLG
jgi:hypothetical protein